MGDSICTVLGIRTSTTKTGSEYSTIFFSCAFSTYEKESATRCEGSSVFSEFVRFDVSHLHPGNRVQLSYQKGFQGKAILSHIEVVTSKPVT